MTYTVTIHFSSADKTYTVLRNGWTLPQTVGAKGKHATQSLNLSILSAEAFALFASEAKQNVKAEVKKDGVVIYQGVVRPYLSTSATGAKEGAVNLEILDYTELLHYYITADEVVENKNLDATIDYLFKKAAVSITRSYPTEFSTDSVGYLALSEGEYVDDVLSTLLYERGYDYRFTATGCEFFATTTETEPTQTISDIRGTLSVQRDDDWSDGLSVTYPRAKEDDIVIYSHKKEGTIANIGGIAVSYPGGTIYTAAKGLYYDGEQHAGETTPQEGKAKVVWTPQYNEKTDANIQLVGLQNVKANCWMDDETCVNVRSHLEDVTLSGARLWLDYFGDFDYHEIPVVSWFGLCKWAWTWNIEVKAHALYLVDDSVEIASADGARPDKNKQTLSYIYTEALAQKFVQREVKRQKTSGFTYSFSSLTAYTAGKFYKLQDSVTGVSQTVRILSCNQGADGIYSIKAESASTMAISDIDITRLYYSDMENSGSTAFRIIASKDTLRDNTETSTLTLSGVITGAEGISYKWTLSGKTLGTDETLTVSYDELTPGANTIICTAYYNSEQMTSATCTLTRINAQGKSVTVQYSYSSSSTEAPQDEIQWASANVFWGDAQTYWSTWQDTAPAEKEGMWIWMRSKVGDGEWSYLRLTGSTGVQGVGILEIVEKYARSNDNVNAPSESEFSETIPKLESTVRYLWNYEIVRLTDGTEKPTEKRVIGVYGDTGATGYSQALITLYQRSATVPSKPSNDTVYYFATGVLEGDIGLWSRAVTTGDDPLYAISASALGQGESYTIESTAWTTPAIMSESGTAGENGYTVMSLTIYQRADSAPSAPTNATFDITNKVLSGIGDWSKTYPENNGKPLWATLATISTRESSVSIPSSSWSTPQVLTQNGATGNGIASITNYYLASASDSGITREGTAGWNPDPTTQATTAVTKYLWNYEDILYTDGTHGYAEPRIIGTYGDNGTPAKVCKLSCDKSVVTRNDRLNTQETYKFTVDVQGYTDTAYLKIGDAARVEVAPQSTTVQLWPYKEATKLTAILYLGDVQKDSIVLEVVNETGAEHYFGVQATAPTKLSTDEMLIAGDYYLNSQDGMVYTYDGTSWVAIDDNAFDSSTNLQKVSSAMADMIKLGTTEKTTATLLAVFKYLCAESAFIQRLFAQSIEIEAGGYIQSKEYSADASVGFKIDSDGHLDAQGAQFKGITLKEGSIISSECMTTSNKAETASIAYINAPPTDPSMWYIYGNYVADFFIPYLGKGEQSCTITYKQKGSSNTKTRNRFNVTTKYNVTYLEIYNDGESEYADGIIVSTLDSKSSPATEQTWYVLMNGATTPALQCGAAYEKWYGITKFAKLSDITLPTEALVGNVRTGGTYSYYDTADSYDISGYTLTANASAVTVSKDGTEYTITKDNYYSVNRWPQINAEYDTKAKGVYVTAIMPKEDEADTATVGTNDLPFDKIYAHSLIGIKDGETESTATFDKVYGAVFN